MQRAVSVAVFVSANLLLQLHVSSQQCNRESVGFTRSVLRDCVSDAWQLHENGTLDPTTCAMKCARLSKCRAFTMDGGCRLFVFDECSRGLLRAAATCNRTAVINVRRVSGVPAGRVCPSSFAFAGSVDSFNGSLYRRISQSVTWTAASVQCGGGDTGVPSKLAELDDGLAEISSILTSTGLTSSNEFWVAAALTSGLWGWSVCGVSIATSSDIWSSGEPNNTPAGADRARITSGRLSDYTSSTGFQAACECVDPFYLL